MAEKSPGGKSVGRVSIRALPDTSKFRDDLKIALERIEKSMKVTIKAVVDSGSLRQSVHRAVKGAEAAARREPVEIPVKIDDLDKMWANRIRRDAKKALGAIEAEIPLDINGEDLRDRLNNELSQLNETVEFALDPELDPHSVAEVRRDVDAMVTRLQEQVPPIDVVPEIDDRWFTPLKKKLEESIKRIDSKVPLTIDGERFRDEYRRWVDGLQEYAEVQMSASLSEEERLRFQHEIRRLVDEAEDNSITLNVDANTLTTRARLSWLARDRFVTYFTNINAAAYAKTASMLKALTGIRLIGDWAKNLTDFFAEIDRKLPKIALFTTGITSLVAVLLSAVSGLVGIGDGLFSILPSLLLLPGLLAGTIVSIVAIAVAMKDAKEQLAELGPSFTNLRNIISGNFWEQAKAPIIEMTNSLMPQLERSFEGVAIAWGGFTGNLARSFQKVYADGRLEQTFAGLRKSVEILGTGTDAFAGAIANLGLVAARYMPRLATWFVRLADRFDNWLSAVATDGRLDAWMEDAIDNIYAVWDVLVGTARLFEGIWKAAEAAGSGGLRGFADTMLEIGEIANSPAFQETLTAIFRGASVAAGGLKQAILDIGDALHERRADIEYFIGEAGLAFGNLGSAIATAFATPEAGEGVRNFIDGISSGLDRISGVIANAGPAFGGFLTLVGQIADSISLAITPFLENVLPALTTTFNEAAPEVEKLGEKLAPVMDQLGKLAADVLPDVAKGLGLVADAATIAGPALAGVVTAIQWLYDNVGAGPSLDFWSEFTDVLEGTQSASGLLRAAMAGDFGFIFQFVSGVMIGVTAVVEAATLSIQQAFVTMADVVKAALEGRWSEIPDIIQRGSDSIQEKWTNLGPRMVEITSQLLSGTADQAFADMLGIEAQFGDGGERSKEAWSSRLGGLSTKTNEELLAASAAVGSQTELMYQTFSTKGSTIESDWGRNLGNMSSKTTTNAETMKTEFNRRIGEMAVKTTTDGATMSADLGRYLGEMTSRSRTESDMMRASIVSNMATSRGSVSSEASSMQGSWNGSWGSMQSFIGQAWSGMHAATNYGIGMVMGVVGSIYGRIVGAMGNAGGWLYGIGASIMEGLASGIANALYGVLATVRNLASSIVSTAASALQINSPSKIFRDYIGGSIIEGLVVGLDNGAHLAHAAMARVVELPTVPTPDLRSFRAIVGEENWAAAQQIVNLTVNNPVGEPTEDSIRKESQILVGALNV